MTFLYNLYARLTLLQPSSGGATAPAPAPTPNPTPSGTTGTAAQQASGGFGDYFIWIMIIGMIVVMYFVLIRPQRKQQKLLQAKIAGVKKGDKVLTAGGFYVTVLKVKDAVIIAQLGDAGRVEIAKQAITNVIPDVTSDDDDDDDDDSDTTDTDTKATDTKA